MTVVLRPILRGKVVETSLYKRIRDAVDYATGIKQPAVIRGRSGQGKSTALADICNRDYRSIYLTASGMQTTMARTFQAIAMAASPYRYTGESYAETHTRLFNEAPRMAKEGRFLVIDEANRLDLATTLEVLGLWEFCGLPVILCGNNEILKKTRTATAAFDQIKSRIGMEVQVSTLERNDFVLVGMEYHVSGNDAFQALANYGMRTSMREACRLLEYARMLAGDAAPITLIVLQDAIQLTAGNSIALKMLDP